MVISSYALCMHSDDGSRFNSRTNPSRPARRAGLCVLTSDCTGAVFASHSQYALLALARSCSMRNKIGLDKAECADLKHVTFVGRPNAWTGAIGSASDSRLYSSSMRGMVPARRPFRLCNVTRTSCSPSSVHVPCARAKCNESNVTDRMRPP